jgi:aldehyde dehydrogenase (NAD+)
VRGREPEQGSVLELTHPATGEVTGRVALGGEADVNRAVAAAKRAFDSYSQTSPEERIELLECVLVEFDLRAEDLARAVVSEVGAPLAPARGAHVPTGRIQIATAIEVLKSFSFSEQARQYRDPQGAAGLITPGNFPVLQPTGKIVSALAQAARWPSCRPSSPRIPPSSWQRSRTWRVYRRGCSTSSTTAAR